MKLKQNKLNFQIVLNIWMFGIAFMLIPITAHIGVKGLPNSIIVNAVIGIISMIGLSILYLVTIIDTSSKLIGSQLFEGMIIMTYLGSLFDNMSWVIEGIEGLRLLNFIMNMCAFLVMPLSLVVFWNYQLRIFIGKSATAYIVRKVVNAFAVLDCIFILIGSFTGFLFCIDLQGNFVIGKGLSFVYIYPFILVGCCVFENLRKEMRKGEKISLLSFGFIPVVTIATIGFFPEYSYVYAAYFLDLILIYGTVENKRHIESLEKSAKIAEQNRILGEQQTQIMISQIQPHFLYNTLTSIYQLCYVDTKQAQKVIHDFSIYLRANMDGIQTKYPIPFEKELDHTKTYLEIELLRFSDILKVEYDIEVTDFRIPALSLQPLVENAVKYGIRSREDGGTVRISTRRRNGKIYISVEDDGMGFDVNESQNDGRSHVGIENTRKRLKLMMDADLCIESKIGVGTITTIIIKDMENKDESSIG